MLSILPLTVTDMISMLIAVTDINCPRR